MMERKSYADMHCSVAQCLEVVGEWWALLILRDAFLGVNRFEDFQRRLGISRNTLDGRLRRLVDAGLLTRVQYLAHPPRFEYRLTAAGRDVWPVVDALRQWGDKHAAPDGPPIALVHRQCGHHTDPVLTCSSCGEPVEVRDVRAEAGPGEVERLLHDRL